MSLNPSEEDNFIDVDINMRTYLKEIISSFKETSNKDFILNTDQGPIQKNLLNQ